MEITVNSQIEFPEEEIKDLIKAHLVSLMPGINPEITFHCDLKEKAQADDPDIPFLQGAIITVDASQNHLVMEYLKKIKLKPKKSK